MSERLVVSAIAAPKVAPQVPLTADGEKLSAEYTATLAALPDLKFIGVLATGYNIVDVAAAKAAGMPVVACAFGFAHEPIETLGADAIMMQYPMGAGETFEGMIDLITMKAYTYTPEGNGKAAVSDIPADMKDTAEEAHGKLVELIAEGNDALTEQFFDKGTLDAPLLTALMTGSREKRRRVALEEIPQNVHSKRFASKSIASSQFSRTQFRAPWIDSASGAGWSLCHFNLWKTKL